MKNSTLLATFDLHRAHAHMLAHASHHYSCCTHVSYEWKKTCMCCTEQWESLIPYTGHIQHLQWGYVDADANGQPGTAYNKTYVCTHIESLCTSTQGSLYISLQQQLDTSAQSSTFTGQKWREQRAGRATEKQSKAEHKRTTWLVLSPRCGSLSQGCRVTSILNASVAPSARRCSYDCRLS